MTRLATISPLRAWETVSYRAGSYIMTPADFVDGCFIGTVNGRAYGTGETSNGWATLPLNVPLCAGCDQLIVDHLCPDCEQVFVGDPGDAHA